MAVQLTPEQEQRIQAVVNQGAYPSVQEALDAAVGAVEAAAHAELHADLETSLLAGIASRDSGEEQFWVEVDGSTGRS